MLAALLVIVVSVSSVTAQMIPQCPCSRFEPCYAQITGVIEACADRCQRHFTAAGGNYARAKQCLKGQMGTMRQALTCARDNFGQVCSADGSGMVPKRYTETIQLAAFREITGMMRRSGTSVDVSGPLKTMRKAIGCIVKCVQTQSCVSKKCGLALPSDNQIISTFKGCAMRTGALSSGALRNTCSCLVGAGFPSLAPLCGTINF